MVANRFSFKGALAWLCLVALLPACALSGGLAASKPVVSIGAPAHGAQVNVGQEVLIQVSAADVNGIARIELWVNGQLQNSVQSPSPQQAQATVLRWTPATPGPHMLVVQAVNARNVMSDPAAVTVNAVGAVSPTLAANPPTVAPTTAASTTLPTAPTATTTACANDAVFVEHVTVPDGTNWSAGQAFNKIWRVRNTGTCAWGPGYELVYVGGEAMATQSSIVVPVVAPGATVDLLVAMIAPTTPGTHSGQWRLRNSTIGLYGPTITVSINVLGAQSGQAQPTAQPPAQPPPAGCPGAPVIESFSASPGTITAGQSATLSWGKVDNATSAVIDQGIGGIATPGTTTVKPDKTTTYTLTATGCGGTAARVLTITVNPSVGVVPVVPGNIVIVRDLAVTKIGPVSTTRADKVYVDLKNNGNVDIDADIHVVCAAIGRQRINLAAIVPAGSDQKLHLTQSKGGTGSFFPSMIIDVQNYLYEQVTCVVELDGDPTPNDNKMTISIP